ncbi:MAG: glutamate racemase [Candidatus Electrothrix aestuarii]|uniref:Glutamate racemase n=1 Tax=Candidatus Electrothrix aestuarii TaxID=3062594 RepID=A0AAU8LS46_9BACT|nr:glutamate racemase [Candidatus Electrothrix aestuarii]WPD21632.1 MAG: glutamate racemase [Candidatus Electrothrix sp. GW3-3]
MIGIFDSGVGGMTVARTIEQVCPQYPLLYFGDVAHTPYGSKSSETIIGYSRRNTDFLLSRGAQVIVVACNSAASTSVDILRQEYTVPIIDVITATTSKAATGSANKRIGIIGTRATVQSGIYEKQVKRINPDCKIYAQACPLLVPLIEEGWLNKRETKMIIRRYLQPLRQRQIDTLILGCTHYPLLSHLIQPKIGKKVQLINSSIETAWHLKSFLDNSPEITSNIKKNFTDKQAHCPEKNRFFVSDSTPPLQKLADGIFGRKINLITTHA